MLQYIEIKEKLSRTYICIYAVRFLLSFFDGIDAPVCDAIIQR